MTEQEKIDKLVAEKRHNAVIEAHGNTSREISAALEKSLAEQNKITSDAVVKNTEAIKGFTEAIKKLPPPEVNVAAPEITIQTDQEKVITSLDSMCQQICEGQATIIALLLESARPKKWVFEIQTEFNRIKQVNAIEIKS